MTDTNQKHSGGSTYRESLIEKRFLNDLLTALWPEEQLEVLRPEVDIAGYDLVLEARQQTRHVQLKSSIRTLKKGNRSVRGRLCEKPAGCVLCIVIDDKLEPLHYRWFGSGPQQRLRSVLDYERACHPVTKKERPDTYIVPACEFIKLSTMEEVIEKLFGPKPTSSERGLAEDCRP